MTQEHLTNPPPESVVIKLLNGAPFRSNQIHERDRWLIEHAYQAGADQELEACCEWFSADRGYHHSVSADLRAGRRPKPPSLKEQALEALDEEQADMSTWNYKLIRSVLESLPD